MPLHACHLCQSSAEYAPHSHRTIYPLFSIFAFPLQVYAGLNQQTGELMAVKALDLMDRRGNHMQTQLADLQQVRSDQGGWFMYFIAGSTKYSCSLEGEYQLKLVACEV